MEYMIETNNLNRIFPVTGGEFHALKDISVQIPKKSLTILKGRSGSGKTTLLNILGALDRPTSGSLLFEGIDICDYSEKKRELLRRKEIGFVFQSVSLIPMMNAYENVEFSLRLAGIREGRRERVEECLKLVGLGNRMEHMPQEMSGGEQQRVAIARALAHRPKVIFADEPTAELDSATAAAVMKLFRDLVEREEVTIVMTTHDIGLMSAGTLSYELEDGAVKSNTVNE
ncbi:MAG: ABC transporter ATP-binding protein [Lachnospiraceae bacterium]|nr:ABC transporter ATP-binding protein [Lachnospiraceae bacterium]